MPTRFDWSDRSATAAVLLGVLAAYLPWYAYTSGGSHVAVNGFRASALGFVFFLLVAAEALLVLMRNGTVADLIGGRISDRGARTAVAATTGVVLLVQLILIAGGGRAAGAGFVVAVLALVAMALAAWLRGYDAEPRRTVRELLGEELPD
ncbi:MAG TPA: hypothetical protein VF155_02205 [Candidatus Dormibacteraeota bacterium]